MSSLIEVREVSKVYDHGLVPALEQVSLDLDEGRIHALTGVSGCGKSTLLNIIGTLDTPTSGCVRYRGKSRDELGDLYRFRREFIGFIFQFHHLVPVLTLRENVEAALLPDHRIRAPERRRRAEQALRELGILQRADAFATEVSGGERQRGAIARALVNRPKVILADEPTGNVDSATARAIMEILVTHVQRHSGTLLIATHDPAIAGIADVVIRMADGRNLPPGTGPLAADGPSGRSASGGRGP